MKRFKKVLALVLAGVMALALLTACGETDPDQIMPADGTYDVVKDVNDKAFDLHTYPPLTYSVKYSEVTRKLLMNWVENYSKTADEYAKGYNEAVKDLGNVKIVAGLTNAKEYPKMIGTNPAYTTSVTYDALVNTNGYELGNRIGVAFYTYPNTNRTVQLVCVFQVPKQ